MAIADVEKDAFILKNGSSHCVKSDSDRSLTIKILSGVSQIN